MYIDEPVEIGGKGFVMYVGDVSRGFGGLYGGAGVPGGTGNGNLTCWERVKGVLPVLPQSLAQLTVVVVSSLTHSPSMIVCVRFIGALAVAVPTVSVSATDVRSVGAIQIGGGAIQHHVAVYRVAQERGRVNLHVRQAGAVVRTDVLLYLCAHAVSIPPANVGGGAVPLPTQRSSRPMYGRMYCAQFIAVTVVAVVLVIVGVGLSQPGKCPCWDS